MRHACEHPASPIFDNLDPLYQDPTRCADLDKVITTVELVTEVVDPAVEVIECAAQVAEPAVDVAEALEPVQVVVEEPSVVAEVVQPAPEVAEAVIEAIESAAEVVAALKPLEILAKDVSLEPVGDKMDLDDADYSTWSPIEPALAYTPVAQAQSPLNGALEVPVDLGLAFSLSNPSGPDANLDLMDVDEVFMDLDFSAPVEELDSELMNVDEAPLAAAPAPFRREERVGAVGKTVISPLGIELFVPSGMGSSKAAASGPSAMDVDEAPLVSAQSPVRRPEERVGAVGTTVFSPLGVKLYVPAGMGRAHLAVADRGRQLGNSTAAGSSSKARPSTPPRRSSGPLVHYDTDDSDSDSFSD